MTRESFVLTDGVPSAIVSDGVVTVPLYAVNQISLNEAFHLPTIGSSTMRAAVGTHDDSVTLSGLLVGAERFASKFTLETLAESGKRGSMLEGLTAGIASGLILITGMTVRTDMQIESLSFTASAGRRDVLEVSMTLVHMPRPGVLVKALEVVNLGVQALRDLKGR
jgi:hypothetical protein